MKEDNRHLRLFIAVSLPEEIKLFLHDLQGQLRKSSIKANWAKPAAMHLTLKFLGNMKINKIDTVKTCLMKVVERIPIHALYASGIGGFPSVRNTRVIWSGINGQTDGLEKLANHLEDIFFDNLGIQKETKRFFPHLTIARVKKPIMPKRMVKLIRAFENFRSEEFFVSDIKLFQSELKSSGAVHNIIFSAPFKK